jgi:CheY-like chemotaxis protein
MTDERTGEMKQRSILVVDDDLDILAQTQAFLEAAGYTVTTADGEKKAEALLKTFTPDLAVLDLMMENQDSGFVLAYKIKKVDPGIPVIIVTAVTGQTGIAFDAESGGSSWIRANAIIEKPIRHEQLLAEIKRLLK